MHVTSPPSFLPPIMFPSLFPFCHSRNPTARFATIFHWPTLLSLIHIPLPIIIHLASTCRTVAFSWTKVFPHWGLLGQVLMHPIHVVSSLYYMYLLLSTLGGVVNLPSMLQGCPVSEPQSSGELSPVPRFIGKLTSTQGWQIPYLSHLKLSLLRNHVIFPKNS